MRTLLVPIAFAGLAYASAVAAQPVGDTYSVSIPYADLNLSNPAGVEALKGRIAAQAGRTCGATIPAPLKEVMDVRQCRAGFARAAEQRLQLASVARGGSQTAD